MDYMTLLDESDIAGDGGMASHRWPLFGMSLTSMSVIIGGSIAAAIIAAAIAYAIVRKTSKHGTQWGCVPPIVAVAAMIVSAIVLSQICIGAYTAGYSPYEENAKTFASSYGIDPKDVTVDREDCGGCGCVFGDVFEGKAEGRVRGGGSRRSWLANQWGDGRNRPVRITVATRTGIRRMTIRLEGDNRLYLYEGTGDRQKLVIPHGAAS